MKNTVKPSDILQMAAEILQEDADKYSATDCSWIGSKRRGVCDAISRTSSYYSSALAARIRAKALYASLFEPMRDTQSGYWFRGFSNKTQQHRIMTLLLTAEMARSVGE